ncbi:MAG: PD40 domain-containing protein [Actinobacteria bacterium]|jgi:hypothetical protein|nr:PD40 domain-containing protein [Actinomycetota bacterium]
MRKILVICLAALGLVAGPVGAAHAAFPGGNGRIYYERDSGEAGDPTRIVGVEIRYAQDFDNVVEGGAAPALSPNGRWMAYERATSGGHELVVARADGSGSRVMAAGAGLSMPGWSADGTHLVAVTATGSLVLVDAASGAPAGALPGEPGCTYQWPVWSPTGDRIAASRTCVGDADHRIVTMATDGTGVVEVTDDSDPTTTTTDTEPDWAPDGTRLVFGRVQKVDGEDAQNGRIWIVDRDGDDLQAMTDGAVPDQSPVWSPDGRFLAFSRERQIFDESLGEERVIFTYWLDTEHPENQVTWPMPPVKHTVRDWAATPAAYAACPQFEVPSGGFHDSGGIHGEAIDCAHWHDLVEGRSEREYGSAQPVRRDQMASFVVRLLDRAGVDLPEPTSQGFSDVAGNVHADAINQLAELGIVHGIDDATYAPARPVTRAQMASFLVRAYELAADTDLERVFDEFADDDGSTHEGAIDRAAFAGFAAGTSVSEFDPGASVRRDQMASFLVRTADRLVRDGLMAPPE